MKILIFNVKCVHWFRHKRNIIFKYNFMYFWSMLISTTTATTKSRNKSNANLSAFDISMSASEMTNLFCLFSCYSYHSPPHSSQCFFDSSIRPIIFNLIVFSIQNSHFEVIVNKNFKITNHGMGWMFEIQFKIQRNKKFPWIIVSNRTRSVHFDVANFR